MATLTHTYHQPYPLRLAVAKKVDSILEALLPRRCMVVSFSLFSAGLAVPILMAVGVLPVNLLLGLLGLGLAATGGTLTMILCGEI